MKISAGTVLKMEQWGLGSPAFWHSARGQEVWECIKKHGVTLSSTVDISPNRRKFSGSAKIFYEGVWKICTFSAAKFTRESVREAMAAIQLRLDAAEENTVSSVPFIPPVSTTWEDFYRLALQQERVSVGYGIRRNSS
jgi:hypothetical protein